MGRESSVKAHVEAVQMHFPAMGSQKGVEQLAGTAGSLSARASVIGKETTYSADAAAGRQEPAAEGWGCRR